MVGKIKVTAKRTSVARDLTDPVVARQIWEDADRVVRSEEPALRRRRERSAASRREATA